MYGLYQVGGVSWPLFAIYCILGHLWAQIYLFQVLLGWCYNTNEQTCCETVLITCKNRFMHGLYQASGVSGPLFAIYCILVHFWVQKYLFSGHTGLVLQYK